MTCFRKYIKSFCILSLVASLSSCWSDKDLQKAVDNNSKTDTKKSNSVNEKPVDTVEKGKIKGLVVINVLDKEDYDDCHIKGSINIPFIEIEKEVQEKIDKDAIIVLYCSNYMCSASGAARDQLLKIGYKNVFAYEGGTAEWYQNGYQVDGPCKKPYLQVKMKEPKEKASSGIISIQELKKKLEENKNI